MIFSTRMGQDGECDSIPRSGLSYLPENGSETFTFAFLFALSFFRVLRAGSDSLSYYIVKPFNYLGKLLPRNIRLCLNECTRFARGVVDGWWRAFPTFERPSLLPFSFFFFFFFHPPSSNLLSVKTARRGLYNLSETQATPPPPTNEETTGAREEGGYVYDRNFSPPATSLSLSSSSWFGGKAANKVAARHLFRAFGIYQSASPPVLHRFAEGKSGGYLNGTRGWKFATVIRVPPLSGNLCPPAR